MNVCNGRRQTKTVNGTATGYVYDGPNITQELNGANTSNTPASVRANYLMGSIDEVFAQQTGSGTSAQTLNYLTDALGSTIRLTDKTGTKAVDYTYEPYGATTADASVNNPFQYTGRENDNTGLYYYRARYYSPQMQRFISEDPIGLNGGINGYAYVNGNPVMFVDPTGLVPVENYLNEWACSSKNWGEAVDKARKGKMGPFDPNDPMDDDNRTAAEHYLFGRYLGAGESDAVSTTAYWLTGAYWGFGYQGGKMLGLFPNASPPSYAQLYWAERAYTDMLGFTAAFPGAPGNCPCDK